MPGTRSPRGAMKVWACIFLWYLRLLCGFSSLLSRRQKFYPLLSSMNVSSSFSPARGKGGPAAADAAPAADEQSLRNLRGQSRDDGMTGLFSAHPCRQRSRKEAYAARRGASRQTVPVSGQKHAARLLPDSPMRLSAAGNPPLFPRHSRPFSPLSTLQNDALPDGARAFLSCAAGPRRPSRVPMRNDTPLPIFCGTNPVLVRYEQQGSVPSATFPACLTPHDALLLPLREEDTMTPKRKNGGRLFCLMCTTIGNNSFFLSMRHLVSVRFAEEAPCSLPERAIRGKAPEVFSYPHKKIEYFKVTNKNAHIQVTKRTKPCANGAAGSVLSVRLFVPPLAVPVFVPIKTNKISTLFEIGTNRQD